MKVLENDDLFLETWFETFTVLCTPKDINGKRNYQPKDNSRTTKALGCYIKTKYYENLL